jgi:hypothetical protein
MIKNSQGYIISLEPNEVIVIGANAKGRHGKGAALQASQFFGLLEGFSEGLCNQTYAFPTVEKLYPYTPIPLTKFGLYVERFRQCVHQNQDKIFYLTSVGTGLAGYKHHQVAPLFQELTRYTNVFFPPEWSNWYERTF